MYTYTHTYTHTHICIWRSGFAPWQCSKVTTGSVIITVNYQLERIENHWVTASGHVCGLWRATLITLRWKTCLLWATPFPAWDPDLQQRRGSWASARIHCSLSWLWMWCDQTLPAPAALTFWWTTPLNCECKCHNNWEKLRLKDRQRQWASLSCLAMWLAALCSKSAKMLFSRPPPHIMLIRLAGLI